MSEAQVVVTAPAGDGTPLPHSGCAGAGSGGGSPPAFGGDAAVEVGSQAGQGVLFAVFAGWAGSGGGGGL